ncbi:MAG: ABC transporter permease [Gammaproteobacteria bacterium]
MSTVIHPASFPLPAVRNAPSRMPLSRLLHAYWTEARYEVLRTLRTPAFLIPTVALPVMLYVFFGIVLHGDKPTPPEISLQVLSGFTMFSVIGPGLFGLGIGFAMERQHGIVTLKRAQPMPFAANLIGKLFSAMTLSLIVITLLLTIATTFAHVELTAAQAMRAALVGVLGVVPFCSLGLLIGSLVSGTGAPAVVNLIFFPMIYLSGLFPFPMPKTLQTAAMIWPAFHLNQLSLAALGLQTKLNPWISAEVLIGFAGLCIYLAARRLTRVG